MVATRTRRKCIASQIQGNNKSIVNKKREHKLRVSTVLPAKSDSDVMFCLQSYQGLIINSSLSINHILRIGLIHKWSIDSRCICTNVAEVECIS